MSEQTNKHKPHILIVDDTPENLRIAAETLSQRMACELSVATHGQQALMAVESEPPDLILLDVMMPGMDGFEVCRILKSNPGTADIPILFLTAKAETADVLLGFEVGGADYITKPFNPSELTARVSTQLRLRESAMLLSRTNNDLRQVLHILCHDLATPVGNILSLIELMNEPGDWREFYSHLNQMAFNAMDLINLVRQMRALDEGKIKLAVKPVGLLQACEKAVDIVRAKMEAKHVRLNMNVSPSLQVLAEPVALGNSVLCNLLTNAVKFSHEASEIRLDARPVDQGFVRLAVCDAGVGIPSALLDKLFDLEAQTSRPGTQGEQGTGFGMPLVKRFVEAFGGHMDVQSRDEKDFPGASGTTVILLLRGASDPSSPMVSAVG